EKEVVARARVDVSDAAAEVSAVDPRLPLRLDERYEERELPAPDDTDRAEEILFEVELRGARRRRDVSAPDIVGPEVGARPHRRADERVFVQLEAPRSHHATARAARLRPRARRDRADGGQRQQRSCVTECRTLASHGRWRVPRTSYEAPSALP